VKGTIFKKIYSFAESKPRVQILLHEAGKVFDEFHAL
jgi:hypothetical protein